MAGQRAPAVLEALVACRYGEGTARCAKQFDFSPILEREPNSCLAVRQQGLFPTVESHVLYCSTKRRGMRGAGRSWAPGMKSAEDLAFLCHCWGGTVWDASRVANAINASSALRRMSAVKWGTRATREARKFRRELFSSPGETSHELVDTEGELRCGGSNDPQAGDGHRAR